MTQLVLRSAPTYARTAMAVTLGLATAQLASTLLAPQQPRIAAWLLAGAIFAAAARCMVRGFARRENRAAWWLTGSRGDTAKVVVGLAYPIGDLALLGVLVAGMELIGWRPDGAWLLIGPGLLLFVVAASI